MQRIGDGKCARVLHCGSAGRACAGPHEPLRPRARDTLRSTRIQTCEPVHGRTLRVLRGRTDAPRCSAVRAAASRHAVTARPGRHHTRAPTPRAGTITALWRDHRAPAPSPRSGARHRAPAPSPRSGAVTARPRRHHTRVRDSAGAPNRRCRPPRITRAARAPRPRRCRCSRRRAGCRCAGPRRAARSRSARWGWSRARCPSRCRRRPGAPHR